MTDASPEQWVAIDGYEGIYEVSSRGSVRSLDRVVAYITGRLVPMRGVVLSAALSRCGHLKVSLSKDNRAETRLVHQLVAQAFIGPRPEGMEVCHSNGVGTDNRVENLRYGSHAENISDMTRHGTRWQLNRTHCPQGHPYDEANTWRSPHRPSNRICLTCRRERDRVNKRMIRARKKEDAC